MNEIKFETMKLNFLFVQLCCSISHTRIYFDAHLESISRKIIILLLDELSATQRIHTVCCTIYGELVVVRVMPKTFLFNRKIIWLSIRTKNVWRWMDMFPESPLNLAWLQICILFSHWLQCVCACVCDPKC